ncbi:calcium/calmodulin-dependent 3',5'-cyclic nucleotide phosphodiesterase 1 isoform X2 [Drosophila subpulchrella]|uniref:calcium/calmodulin-dependent 3',5'-cyclic nucleotide phosphodiesterase 1 isoform X2 n=1 Tax=Drosophila subpulchrella TaxID=1486046 RepID=UPI0018A12BBA|nr:calcium/calmodulin-dependent 3',5'-cyclic nucleotide phosphodiesterase 1 isoform X2 [Drosophila subpulchrella]
MSNLNLSNAPRRLAPGTATPVTGRGPVPVPVPGPTPGAPAPVPAVLTARLTSDNTVASGVASQQQLLQHQVSPERQPPTSCPDSPIRRVSSSLKNSALDFASRFFNKCKAATFTVDGATYTIVASTPESLPNKRDEASGGAGSTGGSSGAASGAASGSAGPATGTGTGPGAGGAGGASTPAQEAVSPTVSELSGSGTNATINGQVARHGSLTIIRRTNSRNFSQIDGQLASPSTTASSSTVPGINFAQTPLSDPLAERLCFRSGSNGSASTSTPAGDSRSSNQATSSGPSANAAAKMQPSSPNATNYLADNIQVSSANLSQTEMVPGRDSTDYTTMHSINVGAGNNSFLRGDTDIPQESGHSFETPSNISFAAGQWDTESLPPVDTPDALNKAAGRIRSLLRRMDHETVAYEDMQRNLHYAARVLEAVFIDESREGCNGNCKNLSCSRHSHGRDDRQQQVDNNNSNSSCSLQEVAPGGAGGGGATPAGDNQDSIAGRTKGVSLAPQTHSGPTGPPSSPETSSATPPAPKLQPALETVRESVMEEGPSKDPGDQAAPPTTEPSAKAAAEGSGASGGSSGSCSNPATVHRQRRLRTPTWARSMSTNKTRLADEDDELSEVQPDAVPPEVREWLASTFTRQMATSRRKSDEKPKFRSVAHAIRAGIFVDRMYRRVSSSALTAFPPDVVRLLKNLDDWTFDVFALTEAASGQVVKYVAYELFNRYGSIHKFKIAPGTLEAFLHRVEEGYCRYRNPYHNNLHAVDVMQTIHYCLCNTGLMNWLTDLEIFASLLAALLHDYEHTGTTNNFHVMSGSETALLYNDRAVLENHHASASFRLLREDEFNILSHLSREEFRELRGLVIEMVLGTDMTNHFQQMKAMRQLLTLQEATIDKQKVLSLVLHCCDISHPAKQWGVHHRWTMLLLEEFFRQGDLEKELGLPFSPLCDRNNTLVAESQICFIDFIVEPSMGVMSDMLELILAPIAPMNKGKPATLVEQEPVASSIVIPNSGITPSMDKPRDRNEVKATAAECLARKSVTGTTSKFNIPKPWLTCLVENKRIWKEQAVKDAEARALATAAEEAAAAAAAAEEEESKPKAEAETADGEQSEAAAEPADGAAA